MIISFVVFIGIIYLILRTFAEMFPNFVLNVKERFITLVVSTVCIIFSIIEFLKEMVSESSIERALIEKQIEIAFYRFKENRENLKLVILMVIIVISETLEKRMYKRKTSMETLHKTECNICYKVVYDYEDNYNSLIA